MPKFPAELALAHRVLNLILVKIRWLVGEETDSKTLYDILDRIEILPMLMADSAQLSEFFEHVEELARAYPVFQVATEELRRAAILPAAG